MEVSPEWIGLSSVLLGGPSLSEVGGTGERPPAASKQPSLSDIGLLRSGAGTKASSSGFKGVGDDRLRE